jgi:hypothetical protein
MVVGFDTLPENMKCLKEEYLHFLFGQHSKTQGYKGVMSFLTPFFEKNRLVPLHLLPRDTINRENLDYYNGLME